MSEVTNVTMQEFIDKEIAVWGEDYVFDLFDKGYEPIALMREMGGIRWSWKLEPLTQPRKYAMVGSGSGPSLLPFSRVRAF
jgi:hypothetical protein